VPLKTKNPPEGGFLAEAVRFAYMHGVQTCPSGISSRPLRRPPIALQAKRFDPHPHAELSACSLPLKTKNPPEGGFLAEAVRFELTNGCPLPVFKTGAIDHSATLPCRGLTCDLAQANHTSVWH
jgi:hypothetical protein